MTISIQPSPMLAVLLVIAHGAALMVLWPLELSLVIKLSLAALILFSAVRVLLRPRRDSIVALVLEAKGAVAVERRDGSRQAARIQPQTTVLPGLVVLLLDVAGRREALTLPPDAAGREAHRQLRLWLKWQAVK